MTSQVLQLNEPATIRTYFEKVRELARGGADFPIDLDEVWPLVYSRKEEAVRALKRAATEDVHYQVFRKTAENSKGGRPEQGYLLTVSCMEFFIASRIPAIFEVYRQVFHRALDQAEQQALQPATPTTEQVLLQQAHLLVDQQQQINQLREEMQRIVQRDRTQNIPAISAPALPSVRTVPTKGVLTPVRHALTSKVNRYSEFYRVTQQETYNYLYKRLQQVYGVNVYRLQRLKGETLLDALERYGHMDRLYSLVCAELSYSEE